MILDETNHRNLIFLILQFLEEECYRESLHLLEQESKIFFNFHYLGETITNGHWEEAEKYLSAFTEPNDNSYSRKMFFELYKQKYYEAVDRNDDSESVSSLWKDLRKIPVFPDDAYDDLIELIALTDTSKKEQLPCSLDIASARAKLYDDLKILANHNPCLKNKLDLPNLNKSALLSLIFLICPSRNGEKRSMKEDLTCLVLQFLYEEKYKKTLHKLEQETKIFFNMNYLVELMVIGQWDKAEDYLAAFTELHDNRYSRAMFLEMQKLKYIESFERERNEPTEYVDTMSAKTKLRVSVAKLAKKNPILKDKLRFPAMDKARLLTLMKQTMDWWIPCIETLSLSCNKSIPLESVPTVSYLCDAPSPMNHKFIRQKYRKKHFICELKKIDDPSECSALFLPDPSPGEKIVRLAYSSSGDFILALAEDAKHKFWTWWSGQNLSCKANEHAQPQLHQPPSRGTMTNEIGIHVQNIASCFAIKVSYLFSASGGRISVFDLKNFERVAAFGSPPPTATYFIFLPEDMFAIGLDDGSILIHCLYSRKIKAKLKGHQEKITCLAFSPCFNILISSGADAQLCVWRRKGWTKLTSTYLHCLCTGHLHTPPIANHIQFDSHQIELLVVHERWIGVYEAPTLDCLRQWVPEVSDVPITSATYSCDGEIIYVSFRSGCIKVLDYKTLKTICRINPTAYAQPSTSLEIYPVVIAAHPAEPNQIALGLSNGRVHVLEPLEPKGEWGEPSLAMDADEPDDLDQ